MNSEQQKPVISVVGAGTMGAGIAQVAATYGHSVTLIDPFPKALERAEKSLNKIFDRLVEKGKFQREEADAILGRIHFGDKLQRAEDSVIVIEAIIEDLTVKQEEYRKLEVIVDENCIIASNTSSLAITALASALKKTERFIGIHFFNPAPLMPLVEIVPGLNTSSEVTKTARELINSWGKSTVLAKDTPGFIVNRVARPFYSEPLKMLEEGIADTATIDWAMREIGGFRMGPFELMDLIGNDVNYTVTETVWTQFYYDPRFRPSITQKRLVEGCRFGRKSGRGFYDYRDGAEKPQPMENLELGEMIVNRTVAMLINEAADALLLGIASRDDIDLAMTKGVNYPKGLLRWADEIGIQEVLSRLTTLHEEYGDDRYRPNPLLRKMMREKKVFYE